MASTVHAHARLEQPRNVMRTWIAVFVATALIAAFFGFAGIAEGAFALAGALAIGFAALAVIALLSPPRPRREA